jgi:hypothetical protein
MSAKSIILGMKPYIRHLRGRSVKDIVISRDHVFIILEIKEIYGQTNWTVLNSDNQLITVGDMEF